MGRLQILALYVVRALGGFAFAQHLTRHRLRILCYHGFSLGDEHVVAPYMFMRAETFERRLKILAKRRIPVIALDEAVEKLKTGKINSSEAVITLDDGWTSNLTVAAPLLKKYQYPACVYVTTEHLDSRTEAFNVIALYLILRSGRPSLTLSGIHPIVDGTYDIGEDPYAGAVSLIAASEKAFSSSERPKLLEPIASALGAELSDVLKSGRFRLVQRGEIQQLLHEGLDVQLHTHTHRLPDDFGGVSREIEQNRAELRAITGREPTHFCYPSGIYSDRHPEWLAKLGIVSATTCDPGLNGPDASTMLLKRYLDNDRTPAISFEAEVCGLRELARQFRTALSRVFGT
jgi:peptidoglycan/xylan/chitin deacetylase (PgdA/CDA1 family)